MVNVELIKFESKLIKGSRRFPDDSAVKVRIFKFMKNTESVVHVSYTYVLI